MFILEKPCDPLADALKAGFRVPEDQFPARMSELLQRLRETTPKNEDA